MRYEDWTHNRKSQPEGWLLMFLSERRPLFPNNRVTEPQALEN